MKYLLKKKKLKITESRLEILAILANSNCAISYNDIESETKGKLDKVTVYRTLDVFESKGIIHSVYSNTGAKLYSFCKEECTSHQHSDNHVHFNCSKCNETTCLYEIKVPLIKVPNGYQIESSKLIVNGICMQCS